MTPPQPKTFSRRSFVSGTALGAIALSQHSAAHANPLGANDRLRIGVIGCGSQAGHHVKALLAMQDGQNVEITAVCDVFDKRAKQFAETTGGEAIKDYRKLLDRKDVDYV